MLVLAGRGHGKTTFLKGLVLRYAKRGYRFIVWDYVGKFRASSPNIHVLRNCELEEAASAAIRCAPCTLVCDEADVGIPADLQPAMGSAVREILLYGRNWKATPPHARRGPVALIASCRRAVDIHPKMRALADVIFVGRMNDEDDAEWARKRLRIDGVTTQQIQDLPKGHFLRRDCS